MYLQSMKSVKHNAAKSDKEKPTFSVRCLYSSFVHRKGPTFFDGFILCSETIRMGRRGSNLRDSIHWKKLHAAVKNYLFFGVFALG
jgi:hypothetical protein